VDVFEIGLARSDVTVICRAKVKMDVALDTRAGRVLIRDLCGGRTNGCPVCGSRCPSEADLLEQKVTSGEVKDVALTYSGDSCLNETFNEGDDEVPIGGINDHELLEALENMVLRTSKGLRETQGKALRDLVFEFRNIWRVRLSADGPAKVTPLKVHLKPARTAKVRRYVPKHLNFMRKLLQEMCSIRRNPHNRCSSPFSIVPKPNLPDEF